MKLSPMPLTLALIVAACSGNPTPAATPAATGTRAGAQGRAPAVSSADAGAATITPSDMYQRIAYLASDEMAGRNTPSPGLEMAASYVAEQFASFGLSPAGDDGKFIQRWPYEQAGVDISNSSMAFKSGSAVVTPRINADFFVLPSALSNTATAGVAYVGEAKTGGSPVGAAASGKFAAFLLPGAEPNAEWQAGLTAAIVSAMQAGVGGIIFILDPAFDRGMIPQIGEETASQQGPVFIVGLDYGSAKQAFANAGQDLDALRMSAPAQPVVLEGSTVEITVEMSVKTSEPPNVVGRLIGSDPTLRNEYIVFSAHMDHVGIGPPDATGDSIYNGADDDASGTATMLEVAQAFASLSPRPARSMIFLGVSGEEKGLLGSKYFSEHPPVPIESIVADINLDMVGRNNPDTVVAIGQDYSTLGALVQQVAAARPELGLVVAPDLWPDERLFFRSDHFNFAKAGVPAIFFTTGLHDQYHKPSDQVELIDRDKISRIGKLAYYLAYEIATRPDAPRWTAQGIAEVQPTGGRR